MSGPLRRPQPASWWLKRGPYFQFMMRELSSLFSGLYMFLLIMMIYRFSQGHEAYNKFRDYLRTPWMFAFHLITLGLALLHTITWFNATPKAMVVMKGEDKLPAAALVVPNYIAWIAASAIVLWIVASR